MKNISNHYLIQSNYLQIFLMPLTNELLLKSFLGKYKYPLFFKLKFSHKKIWYVYSKPQLSILNTAQVLLAQAMLGVVLGYRQQMNLVGIGYQVVTEKNQLIFKLGFSHQICINIPNSIYISCIKSRILRLKSINIQKLKNFAALLRSLRFPNPYKKKGIYYLNEIVVLKQGKKT